MSDHFPPIRFGHIETPDVSCVPYPAFKVPFLNVYFYSEESVAKLLQRNALLWARIEATKKPKVIVERRKNPSGQPNNLSIVRNGEPVPVIDDRDLWQGFSEPHVVNSNPTPKTRWERFLTWSIKKWIRSE